MTEAASAEVGERVTEVSVEVPVCGNLKGSGQCPVISGQ